MSSTALACTPAGHSTFARLCLFVRLCVKPCTLHSGTDPRPASTATASLSSVAWCDLQHALACLVFLLHPRPLLAGVAFLPPTWCLLALADAYQFHGASVAVPDILPRERAVVPYLRG